MTADESKRQKAKARRYKKPLVKDLNLYSIREWLWDVSEQCQDVRWFYDNDEETLINALDGDEEEAYEFKMMFASLCADCDRLNEDLEEEWVPEYFDTFFASSGCYEDFGGLLGFDSYEGDYFGIDGAESWAEDEAKAQLKRLTKDELIAAVRQCMKVFTAYMGLKDRYENLKASMDILRDKNTSHLKMVAKIDELYEKAAERGLQYGWTPEVRALDQMLDNLPDEAWFM